MTFSTGFVVNCAGLYADRIARDFGFSRRYRILPFKGLYLESPEPPESLRCHIYPVPSKTNPFLGVHATVKPDGHWKIGPTAIPALWRENYSGLARFDAGELAEVAFLQLSLLFGSGFDFRRLAWEEIRKQSRRRLVALAGELVTVPLPAGKVGEHRSPGEGALAAGSPLSNWRGGERVRSWGWGTPGIRAQLVALRAPRPRPSPRGEGQTSLVDDFVLEGCAHSAPSYERGARNPRESGEPDHLCSLHVLNAVSPAFTCCLTFAKLVADRIEASA